MNNFSRDVFLRVERTQCPCCQLSYSANSDKTAYEFEEGWGYGEATQVGDYEFECEACKTIFDARTLDIVKKPLKKNNVKSCSEEQMADALKKFENISDVALNGKKITFVDAVGKKNEVDVMEVLLMSHIAKVGGLEEEIANYVKIAEENAKIMQENEELKKRFPNQPEVQPVKNY